MKYLSFKKQLIHLETLDWDELVVKKHRSPRENKLKLLEMANNGKDRPKPGHCLYNAFGNYVNKNNSYYDTNFDKQIRKIRPDWFVHNVIENKIKLLEMARNGEPRPSKTLRQNLYNYTNSSKGGYDSIFDKEIRKLRPDWFVLKPQIVKENKLKLLEMARNGEDRPRQQKHPLGKVLCHYTCKQKNKKNECYDPIFDKEIRNLATQWFKK